MSNIELESDYHIDWDETKLFKIKLKTTQHWFVGRNTTATCFNLELPDKNCNFTRKELEDLRDIINNILNLSDIKDVIE